MKIYPHQLNTLMTRQDPLSTTLMDMFLRDDDPIKPRDDIFLAMEYTRSDKEKGEDYWTVKIQRTAYIPGHYPGTCAPYHESKNVEDVPEELITNLCGFTSTIFSKRYKIPIRARIVLEFNKEKEEI